MTEPAPTEPAAPLAGGRHASWLELFFDLVVVTAVAQLSHRLHGVHSIADVAITAAAFYAVWNVWVSFTLYANVQADKTHRRSMLAGMFGIAVMAAAIPEVTAEHGTIFIVAYIVTRSLSSVAFRHTGAVLVSWSLAQDSAGIALWWVSIWVDGNARYWLWGGAIVIDLVVAIYVNLRPDSFIDDRKDKAGRRQAQLRVVDVDSSHLEERLGLFVVIVLGEAVAQVVNAAAETEWDRELAVSAAIGFWLLVGLWQLTVAEGSSAVPNPHHRQVPPGVLLPQHLLSTAGITGIAASLGSLAEHADGHLSTTSLWLMCGGAALWFTSRAITGIYVGAPRPWLYAWALPGVLVCIVVGLVAGHWTGFWVVGCLAVVTAWQLSYDDINPRGTRAQLREKRLEQNRRGTP